MTEQPEERVLLLVPRGLLGDHRREILGEHLAAELPGIEVEVREVDQLPEESTG